MRIIAGKHKSRKLETLEGNNTRPMMDVMKESVFNTIGPYFEEIEILDLFGGSGALSLEAISRGAKHSYIIDLSRDAIKVITNNVRSLKEENSVTIINTDYKLALKKLEGKQFDLIFLDPPYGDSVPYTEFSNIWNSFLKNIPSSDLDISVSDRIDKNESWNRYSIKLHEKKSIY